MTELEKKLIKLNDEYYETFRLVQIERYNTYIDLLVTSNLDKMRDYLNHVYALINIYGDFYFHEHILTCFDCNVKAFEKCINQVILDNYQFKIIITTNDGEFNCYEDEEQHSYIIYLKNNKTT